MVTTEEKEKARRQLGSKGFLDLPVSPGTDLIAEINKLRKEKNAVILAHYYQFPEIQDIADYVGDSLGLAQQAADTNADIIVFAGVHFMGETAKVLSPDKKVILPDLNAGCSLADSCPPDKFGEFIKQHPDHVVVTYVNCSAEIKTMSDIVCTSSNAVKIINSIPADKPIIFAPDANLGKYLMKVTGRDMLLWDGACMVHEAFSIDKLLAAHKEHPTAKIIAHPESESHILKVASFIGSTSKLIDFVKNDPAEEFIVATEAGILHQMSREVPHKKIIAAPAYAENKCSCSECGYMKMNTLQKLYLCMKYEEPEITLPEDIIKNALKPIQRMLELS
ncbi:Quinolinate synthetase [Fulvivirga imtechensis AK7]|uniref:Quinolinate synthase n=1 Tax=Fulvivirga imtechensis AK7 TaxID=1237149 RepID=L8JPM1_9BACT|nr:quinolinate synthase NadA [Fulvivirga imtechensis]ELR69464.1 Quinolinate synthetase [Fulvivirga imtechensis AK7]